MAGKNTLTLWSTFQKSSICSNFKGKSPKGLLNTILNRVSRYFTLRLIGRYNPVHTIGRSRKCPKFLSSNLISKLNSWTCGVNTYLIDRLTYQKISNVSFVHNYKNVL
uniref:Uncharacterized protein n=1 Tax=Cacopsylla melanoneura TaxID=428564 RepID=A0A8D8ZKR9_9HEMI